MCRWIDLFIERINVNYKSIENDITVQVSEFHTFSVDVDNDCLDTFEDLSKSDATLSFWCTLFSCSCTSSCRYTSMGSSHLKQYWAFLICRSLKWLNASTRLPNSRRHSSTGQFVIFGNFHWTVRFWLQSSSVIMSSISSIFSIIPLLRSNFVYLHTKIKT